MSRVVHMAFPAGVRAVAFSVRVARPGPGGGLETSSAPLPVAELSSDQVPYTYEPPGTAGPLPR